MRQPFFATCARGTEDLLVAELTELGARRVRQDPGGVRFMADWVDALRICLWTRIAMRVLFPLGEADAPGAEGLYAASFAIPWEEHLTASSTFAVEASIRESEHSHTGFVALKVKDAIADRLREKLGRRPNVDSHHPDVRVVAHLAQTRLSLSLDLCGAPLYQRGYRVRSAAAPLKETLAAAILRAAGYTGEEPLVDPMCGSGTFLLEAAQIASRRAPSLRRTFAVENWPQLGARVRPLLAELRAEAEADQRASPSPIFGFDKSEEALEAAERNVREAGFQQSIRLSEGDATGPLELPTAPGLLVTNPPYGERLGAGGQKGMKSFYFKLGDALGAYPGWRMAILAGNPSFESAFHHRPKGRRALWNGPIRCMLLDYPALSPRKNDR